MVTIKNKLSIEEAEQIQKAFNGSRYWLDAMVQLGDISRGQAGYMILKDELNKYNLTQQKGKKI